LEQQLKKDDTSTPDVALLCKKTFGELWGNVKKGTNKARWIFFMFAHLDSSAEVNKFDFQVFRSDVRGILQKDNILKFKIPVDNALIVKVSKCREELFHDDLDSFFFEVTVVGRVVLLERTAFTELSDHVVVAVVHEQVVEFDDVGVV
jgi:hypothetical protein